MADRTLPKASKTRRPRGQDVVAEAKQDGGGTQAIDRALSVLFAFTRERPSWRVQDLAEHLGLNKSTVYRLLQALGSAHLVRRVDEIGTFQLGASVLDLASCFLANFDMGEIARPVLQDLAQRTGESVNLGVLDGSDAVRIDHVRGTKTPQFVSHLGLRIPVYCSGNGRALVFDHSDDALRELLSQSKLEKLTDNTITDQDAFIRSVHEQRKLGWAVNDEESEVGIRAVGAPIRDHDNVIVAAVSISAPTFRLPRGDVPRLALAVKDAADRISALLGAKPQKASDAA